MSVFIGSVNSENKIPATIVDLYNYVAAIAPDKISINKVKGTREYRIKVWDYGFFTYPFKNGSLTTFLSQKYPNLEIESERRFGNPYNPPKTSSILVKEKK